MIEVVNAFVDVASISRKGKGIVVPLKMQWKNKTYHITKIGLRHPVTEGAILHHIFECSDGKLDFRLRYNTQSLQWLLEAITDGLPS